MSCTIARTGPYSLVKRATEYGYIVQTPLAAYHVMHDGERLCGSADVQKLRSAYPHIAKWAALEINRYATRRAQQSRGEIHGFAE